MNPEFKKQCDIEIGFMIDIQSGFRICNNDLTECNKPNDHLVLKEHLIKNLWKHKLGTCIKEIGILEKNIEILFSVNDIEPIDYASFMRYRILGYLRFLNQTDRLLLKLMWKDISLENRLWVHITKVLKNK